MKERIIGIMLTQLIKALTPEMTAEVIDKMLDEVERRNTKNSVVMMLCSCIRIILGVPDDDVDQKEPI